MQLLNQLRADAGKISDEAIPEVVTAVDQLVPPTSLAKVVVALIGRLEQDIPGLVHVVTDHLPDPLTTPVAEPASTEVSVPPNLAPAPPSEVNALTRVEQELKEEREKVAALQAAQTPPDPLETVPLTRIDQELQELKEEREKVAALQAAQTPRPGAAPVVSTMTQETP